MTSTTYVSKVLTQFLILLDLQTIDVECGHNIFRRYYYYYYYHTYRNFNTTKYGSSEFKGWYAGAAVGIVLGSLMFLLLLSVCMKYCIQKINRSRFVIKPTTTVRTTAINRPDRNTARRHNSSYTMNRRSCQPFNIHRQVDSNRLFRHSSSYINIHTYRKNQRPNLDNIFSIERQLPEYREVCSPPPEYTLINQRAEHTENCHYTAQDQQEDNQRDCDVVSPPPSYREVAEQRTT